MSDMGKSVFSICGIFYFIAVLTCAGYAADFSPADSGNSEVDNSQAAPVYHITQSVRNDLSEPLISKVPLRPLIQPGVKEIPLFDKQPSFLMAGGLDPVTQDFFTLTDLGYGIPSINAPVMGQNFEGISSDNNLSIIGGRVLPPDTNGDIGLNHYVQWVNLLFAVYNRSGALVYGPAAGNVLWSGFGGACETNNSGDPIVLYDRQADRWFMSQFALASLTGPFYQCIAVSATGDPTGAWYRYAFLMSNTKINDYPKFGIWPDGYYMSINQFDSSNNNSYAGVGVVAFERSKMLQGLPAQSVIFDLFSTDPDLFGMLPSHLNGPDAPPQGSPDYFVSFDDDANGYASDALEIWGFHVDWTTPANSAFTKLITLPTASFNSNLCDYARNCIPQPGTSSGLNAISDRLMNRLQYRNFGTYQTMVVNHTVNIGDGSNHAGVRWYELANPGNAWMILQQGSYSPDTNNRWMGSLALDGMGNMALGYSVSSSSTYPSIRFSGRLASDPFGLLTQGETMIVAGSGSQTSTSYRWGDYSSMSVDPSDDSTFWYTQEYYSTTSSSGWQTRIASFSICPNNHARTTVSGPGSYATLGAAYAGAAMSDTITAQSVTFRENLNLNQNKAITLAGGYNCGYSGNPFKTTIIGSLSVSSGSVIVDNISIQ